jgi:hypothetical protein
MVLLLAPQLPSTMKKLGIHSYDALISYIMYTKQLFSYLFPYSGSVEMSYYSYPPSTRLLLDFSVDTGFLLVAGFSCRASA